ncbi:thioredoxin family protein [Pradoshia sp.]|uniref:thioredoxin family protein n=1 Tax=Pradoshia sp. TaxID=2651281 RepID=UPI003F064157
MKEMKELTSLNMIEDFVQENPMSFLYVSRQECSVCHAVLPRVRELLDHFPDIRLGHIDANAVPEVAAAYSIFTVPVILYFIEGQEVLRKARFIHFEELAEQIEKIYGLNQ